VKNILLSPLSVFYGVITRTRHALYRNGIFRTHDLNAPVISIGNITVGGTGKTPLVAWFANALAEREKKVCVLTRGYGRENSSQRILVSNGKEILADAKTGGDEPLMLAENLINRAAVVCDKDRASAGRWAKENLGSDVFILDDGFQHLRIKRTLDIVAVDATNPFGNGCLLPRGRLRERLSSLRRADCIIITKTNLGEDIDELRATLESHSKGRPVFFSRFRTIGAKNVGNNKFVELKTLPDPCAAFCALGNPKAFFKQIKHADFMSVHKKAFRDHHYYTQQDIEELEREAKEKDARCLMTTAKDAVKLRGLKFELPCYALEIEVEIDEEEKLKELLFDCIEKRLSD
jgi:tetraacyldisaccharide 4'-kinase